jgi:hypothetical protein
VSTRALAEIVRALAAGASPETAAASVHRLIGLPLDTTREAAELVQRAGQLLTVPPVVSGAAAEKAGESG